ncbi:MAG: hydroxymethylglutaryl-CoA lyase [Pseudomonadota bacterium]
MGDHVTIYEVGPRDGLQNEAQAIPTKDKIALINALSQTCLKKIEVSSFVSPKWVPQLADAADVFAGIKRADGVTYSALVPNEKGLAAAEAAGADEIALFASASEGFSQKNTNGSIAQVLDRARNLAQKTKLPLRGYVSCIDKCPYDGPTAPDAVLKVAMELLDIGCFEISLGDTIGQAPPDNIARLLDHLLKQIAPNQLAGHFHDTSGQALENVAVSLDRGIRTFDSAVGGLGGCPYAPGAKGNLSTLSLLDFLDKQGFETGVDMGGIQAAQDILLSWELGNKA